MLFYTRRRAAVPPPCRRRAAAVPRAVSEMGCATATATAMLAAGAALALALPGAGAEGANYSAAALQPRRTNRSAVDRARSRCTTGTVIDCEHEVTHIEGRWVGWQKPLGQAPPEGWPVVVLYHGWNLMNSQIADDISSASNCQHR